MQRDKRLAWKIGYVLLVCAIVLVCDRYLPPMPFSVL
jgi:hypothetical protein